MTNLDIKMLSISLKVQVLIDTVVLKDKCDKTGNPKRNSDKLENLLLKS